MITTNEMKISGQAVWNEKTEMWDTHILLTDILDNGVSSSREYNLSSKACDDAVFIDTIAQANGIKLGM